MFISLIVARTKNHVIGRHNQMPWHLPRDLMWFREKTIDKPIIMGRKTYESIGRLLPKRPNIILSRTELKIDGAYTATSLAEAIELAKKFTAEEIMVIGGGELFKQALPLAQRLYLTEIEADIEGDTYFEFNEQDWQLISKESSEIDEHNNYVCHFMQFERI
ncbi:dihydrofolate reductase [[Haemophilus] ducreyi]|uniref:dihydrofolate reductase n=1 Tax=Haemophilus ducreyi TaxID=730 RepID=UPI0006553AEA|nr:dihydrofolate reductase [[Haemophilus] ducreyi]AKO45420.1 dihydrofolate reductase [[Haemophilus] ducreyi]AKO46806.1 dihydrofolate reductase [[Haemophilus] ducreyi]ANF61428.1 dihydrofolate reductase [[Haemophilus] ducreyi]ANF67678.1 dihydrofolate reductase [[Haemophilus] ducreyi]ANF69756.1 dihydrofolate reductase [[Haemophilus] ducreyi]